MKNYYEILELPNFSLKIDIKKAFKRLAVLYHPDKNPNNPSAEEQFKEINEAYQVLANDSAKEKYDKLLQLGYTHWQLKNEVFKQKTQENTEEKERDAAKLAAWHEYMRKKNEKSPYDVSNVQGFFIALFFVSYMLAFANAMLDLRARLKYIAALEAVEQKSYKKALTYLDISINSDRKFTKAHALAAQIEAEQFKHYGTAAENLSHAIEFTETIHPEYFYQRGLLFCHLNNAKNAAKDFNLFLNFYPNSLEWKTKIAYHYYYILQNDELSLNFLIDILQKDIKNNEVALDLGDIYFRKQNYEQAISYYGIAITRGNSTAEPYQKRSICYLDLQNVPKACEDWQKAKSINKNIQNETLDFFCQNQ